jgi:dimethylargininase
MRSDTAGIALVRQPGPRLSEGIVTHIERSRVDLDRARSQHQAYVEALAEHGWEPREVAPADDCPDAVFVEDTLVVCDRLAVVTRPGAPPRRAETTGAAEAATHLGLALARIEPPGTLDGGDVLRIGPTVYVGHGSRTNSEGIRQLAAILSTVGRNVVVVPVQRVLHLKSAVTALPDGTVLTWGEQIDSAPFPAVRPVPEETGTHVVPLGGPDVLIAASAPRTADLLAGSGLHPVVVDIGEFEKLEGCVTCLSVLIPDRA